MRVVFAPYRSRFWLAACVSIGYTYPMKDSGLRIRVEKDLRERFLALCKKQDRPAAQIIREFMRGYLAEHEANDGQQSPTKPVKKGANG